MNEKKNKQSLPFSPVILTLATLLVVLLGLYVFSFNHRGNDSGKLNSYEKNGVRATQVSKSWKTYTDSEYGVSFKYPEAWETSTLKIEHGKIVFFAPKNIQNNSEKLKMFAMDNGYFGIDGLPTKSTTVNGNNGLMVDEGLYGFTHNNKYITFDAGNVSGAKDYLSSIVQTIEFK